MESLLSLSFDYLSSFDAGKIRKGLRQLEGLLAQICLSGSGTTPVENRRQSIAVSPTKDKSRVPRELSQLKDDPAFREFFKLQEGFEWNVAIRLIACLERLLGKGNSKTPATTSLITAQPLTRLPPYRRPKRPPHRLNPRPPPRHPPHAPPLLFPLRP